MSAIILCMVLGAYVMFSNVDFVSNDPTIIQIYDVCGIVMLAGVFGRISKRAKAKKLVEQL